MSATYFVLVSHELMAEMHQREDDYPNARLGLHFLQSIEPDEGAKFAPPYYDPEFSSWWMVRDDNAPAELEAQFIELMIEHVDDGGLKLHRTVLE